jgi:ketosteroid isomerase-like protein
MRRCVALVFIAGFVAACGRPAANVEQEREALLRLDREWSASAKDAEKFLSFMAPDASLYPPGMPKVTGTAALRDVLTKMMAAPGFSLEFAPTKAEVAASGDLGYTTGTYQSTMGGVAEKGKYVTAWKKQSDGEWKVTDDIFNADGSGTGPTSHAMIAPGSITWGDPPPSLPPGSKIAVLSGDPTKPATRYCHTGIPPMRI